MRPRPATVVGSFFVTTLGIFLLAFAARLTGFDFDLLLSGGTFALVCLIYMNQAELP